MSAKRFVICYDCPDDGRRAALARLLSGWGDRVQWSVFECTLQPRELGRVLRAIQETMDDTEDDVLVYQCASIGVPAHRAMSEPVPLRADYWLA